MSPFVKTVYNSKGKPVEENILENILKLAKKALSSGETKIRIIVLNKENKEKLYQVIDKINDN